MVAVLLNRYEIDALATGEFEIQTSVCEKMIRAFHEGGRVRVRVQPTFFSGSTCTEASIAKDADGGLFYTWCFTFQFLLVRRHYCAYNVSANKDILWADSSAFQALPKAQQTKLQSCTLKAKPVATGHTCSTCV